MVHLWWQILYPSWACVNIFQMSISLRQLFYAFAFSFKTRIFCVKYFFFNVPTTFLPCDWKHGSRRRCPAALWIFVVPFKIFLLFLKECERNNPDCLDRAIETEPEWREAEHIPALGIARWVKQEEDDMPSIKVFNLRDKEQELTSFLQLFVW